MSTTTIAPESRPEAQAAISILAALSLCHMLNDTIQSLLPAIYPVLQANYALTFTQIGSTEGGAVTAPRSHSSTRPDHRSSGSQQIPAIPRRER